MKDVTDSGLTPEAIIDQRTTQLTPFFTHEETQRGINRVQPAKAPRPAKYLGTYICLS